MFQRVRYVMTIRQYLGVNAFDKYPDGIELSHEEKYTRLVNAIGLESIVKRCLPFTKEEVQKMYEKDTYMNEYMRLWDFSSGFEIHVRNGTEEVTLVGSLLIDLMKKIGIDTFSNAGNVCILKQAARMWLERDDIVK